MELFVILLAAGIAAGLGALALLPGRFHRQAPAPPPEPAAAPLEPVNEAEELRRLVADGAELKELYARLGFPREIEEECGRCLGELAAMVRTEIPDFAAFRAAVAVAERDLAAPAPAGSAAHFVAADVELLQAVALAGDDANEVQRLLDDDPVRRLLPFIERIPMVRNGERVWRTPVEISLLHKRPVDGTAFERCLDELERLVRTSRLPRPEPLRAEALEAVARSRRDARRAAAYMPTSLRVLAAAVEAWLHRASPEARRRRDGLDALLLGLLRVRRTPAAPSPRDDPRAQAKRYLDSPWMHTPWLTAYALTNLLDAELGALPAEELRQPSARAAVLRWVRDEVASSNFDGEETIRRLHQQEERELYVHSLVYALLRMSRLPATAD